MVSERQIKELANIEKLEVAKIMLQEARAQATEIVYAGWLDDAARRMPEDPAADRSSDDAIITASRIMLSMAATKRHREGTTLHSTCCLEKHDGMERT